MIVVKVVDSGRFAGIVLTAGAFPPLALAAELAGLGNLGGSVVLDDAALPAQPAVSSAPARAVAAAAVRRMRGLPVFARG
ncbi:hypothetical protein GCM10027589_42260 [Actinocorallia lasiicapitis]